MGNIRFNFLFCLRFCKTNGGFRCDHVNITKLYNYYELPTSYCLILEYINGGDLFDAIRESKRFTEVDAVRIIKGMKVFTVFD